MSASSSDGDREQKKRGRNNASAASPASAPAPNGKRVWVLVPFPEPTAHMPDHDNPHTTADEWVRAKNGDPGKNGKSYTKIGLGQLDQVDFNRGDRMYIHGHGGDSNGTRNKLYESSHPNNNTHLTTAGLRDTMLAHNQDIFKSDQVDIRIASCHSSTHFAPDFAEQLSKSTATGNIKGYDHQLNVTEMTRGLRRDGSRRDGNPAYKFADLITPPPRTMGLVQHGTTVGLTYDQAAQNVRAKNHSQAFPVVAEKRAKKAKTT